MPFTEIRKAIQDGDTEKLTLENLEALEKYIPTADEV